MAINFFACWMRCIRKHVQWDDVGVTVVLFTCDGPTTHQSMLKLLGAVLSADDMQAYFPHQCDENKKVYTFLDACHMIKLVCNTFFDWKVLKDKDGQNIKWKFQHI